MCAHALDAGERRAPCAQFQKNCCSIHTHTNTDIFCAVRDYAIHTISSPEWLSANGSWVCVYVCLCRSLSAPASRRVCARTYQQQQQPHKKGILFPGNSRWPPVARASILLRNLCCNLDRVVAVNAHMCNANNARALASMCKRMCARA